MAFKDTEKYYPKELSWLLFNERVLQEAANERTPLVERLKFLAIFSNNLDEFYRVRVANLQRIAKIEGPNTRCMGWPVKTVMSRIRETVVAQSQRFTAIYDSIDTSLANQGIFLVDENDLNQKQREQVMTYFVEQVRPLLVPIMLSSTLPMPNLRDKFIYLAVTIFTPSTQKDRYALIEVPTDTLSRFFVIPSTGKETSIILLEDVIRLGLGNIFSIFNPERIQGWIIKVTRDASLELESEFEDSYINRISEGLKRRHQGAPVRLVYDSGIPQPLLRFLLRKLDMVASPNLIPGSRYHNIKDFMKFPRVAKPGLVQKCFEPVVHPDFVDQISVFSLLDKRDVLLHFPYHSFMSLVDLLREAAIDPKVTGIDLTVYRVASHTSSVLNAIINAARNGKRVTVLMEMLARFDEENNLYWAERLRQEGVQVIVGVRGLKVHSKLCLVTRRDGKKETLYATVGTGNFNEDTARLYTDHVLMTANKKITEEVKSLFEFFRNNYKVPQFKHLLVSPFVNRSNIVDMVEREIKFAHQGKSAYIYVKINNFSDEEMSDVLYKASKAGVQIRMIVRGMLSLVPSKKGLSENIEVISIVGQYLEHTRYLIFGNNGKPRYYLTSADLMSRNLDERVEVGCPVYDKDLQKQLWDYFDIQWRDTDKARVCEPCWKNEFRDVPKNAKRLNSQDQIREYIQSLARQSLRV